MINKDRAVIISYLSQKVSACRSELQDYLADELNATALESNLEDIIYLIIQSLPDEVIAYAAGMLAVEEDY